VIVPGHGPLTDLDGVRQVRAYLEHVAGHAQRAYAVGMPYWEAAETVAVPDFAVGWGHPERMVFLTAAVYRHLDDGPRISQVELLSRAADLAARLDPDRR
jgi:cyclase